jgi:uncharacterized repeat protein (TIGR03803 family)
MTYAKRNATSIFDIGLRAVMLSLLCAGIFAMLPWAQAQTLTVLHNFSGGEDGANPYAGLTMDRAGNLYGTALHGGLQTLDCQTTNGCGTVFELARQGAGFIFRPLYQFQGFPSPSGDGANPLGRVIIGPDGALYGTTEYGGSNVDGCGGEVPGCGTVFRLSPSATICKSSTCNWEETKLYNFKGAPDGEQPLGEIAFDVAGSLYGATYYGGARDGGTVYELTPAQGSWTQFLLVGFDAGENPYGGVQLDHAGNVYGTAVLEGTAFELVPSGSGWTLHNLFDFQVGGPFGLVAGLLVGPSGDLYGGTANGNPNPVLYELSPSNGGWSYNTLYTLSGPNCCGLSANLVMDSAGNLYGTTLGNFDGNYGSVFKLTPSDGGWTYTDLHDFTGGSDGGYPYSSVVIDANGNLYGTTSAGGANGDGVVWEITP